MATIKQVLAPKRKIRKCPNCKSTKGFELSYVITGNGTVKMDFKRNTLTAERETFDHLDSYAHCLNCGKSIDAEYLKTD